MKVRVLGTAAGGGLPQWNCACEVCTRARARGAGRTQDCLAITGDGAAWYLVNASPDIRTQILAAPELTPGPAQAPQATQAPQAPQAPQATQAPQASESTGPALAQRRETPLRGALLTSAELDHTLGLAALREGSLVVFASSTVLDALPLREAIRPYGGLRWQPLTGSVELAGGLSAQAVPVGRKRPRYAAAAPDAQDWVVAYRFTDRNTGGVLVYAPGLAEWTAAFATALDGADCLLLDGSFYTDDEMTRQTGSGATARQMGHLPIVESLTHRPRYPRTRWLYTHLNNTNPVLTEGSPQRLTVVSAGADVTEDGMVLQL